MKIESKNLHLADRCFARSIRRREAQQHQSNQQQNPARRRQLLRIAQKNWLTTLKKCWLRGTPCGPRGIDFLGIQR